MRGTVEGRRLGGGWPGRSMACPMRPKWRAACVIAVVPPRDLRCVMRLTLVETTIRLLLADSIRAAISHRSPRDVAGWSMVASRRGGRSNARPMALRILVRTRLRTGGSNVMRASWSALDCGAMAQMTAGRLRRSSRLDSPQAGAIAGVGCLGWSHDRLGAKRCSGTKHIQPRLLVGAGWVQISPAGSVRRGDDEKYLIPVILMVGAVGIEPTTSPV